MKKRKNRKQLQNELNCNVFLHALTLFCQPRDGVALASRFTLAAVQCPVRPTPLSNPHRRFVIIPVPPSLHHQIFARPPRPSLRGGAPLWASMSLTAPISRAVSGGFMMRETAGRAGGLERWGRDARPAPPRRAGLQHALEPASRAGEAAPHL